MDEIREGQQPADVEQLRMLALFNKIGVWVFGLMTCCGLPHTVIGLMIVSGVMPDSNARNEPPSYFGYFFMGAGLAVMLVQIALAHSCRFCMDWINERSHYNHIIAQGAILCLFAPIGTALGVFTLVVMSRPQVKAAFGATRTN